MIHAPVSQPLRRDPEGRGVRPPRISRAKTQADVYLYLAVEFDQSSRVASMAVGEVGEEVREHEPRVHVMVVSLECASMECATRVKT